jgi:hypothetical protein
MSTADEAYDRLHGVDGHVQSGRLTETDLNDLYPRWLQKVSFTHLTAAVERILDDQAEAAREQTLRLSLHADEWRKARDDLSDQLLNEQHKVNMVRGLLAAYGEAEGAPVDYEFLVHRISEAIK